MTTAAQAIPELYITLTDSIIKLSIHPASTDQWGVWDGRLHFTKSRHRTRLEAADQMASDFMELTGTGPAESETQEDGRIIYSLDDGSALVVLFDGTVRHYTYEERDYTDPEQRTLDAVFGPRWSQQ